MYASLFNKFLTSGDTLQVYKGNELLFASTEDRLLPLLEYLDRPGQPYPPVVIFDTIIGNAAALLSVKANCREVYSPLGSRLAIRTLDRYGIRYHLSEIVPYVQQPNREDMCPMERLSIDKEPEEFYQLMMNIIGTPRKDTG